MKPQNILSKLKNEFSKNANFDDLSKQSNIFLYAGDVPQNGLYKKFTGLSLSQANTQHIKFDVTQKLPLNDFCVDIYQSEDVFEHIELEKLPGVIDEIYRVLKPGGVFRLCLPDYGCDLLYDRTQKDEAGHFLFDPGGGGDFINNEVVNGGHVWFPLYATVKNLLEQTKFHDIRFYHYYDESGQAVTNPIDYSIGHVKRTPDHDERVKDPYRPMSIVVDCIK